MEEPKKTEGAEVAPGSETEAEETVQVLCSFSRHELNALKAETGALANATAVTCFVRKNLKRD